ncbi:MAG: LytTR family DNA-binding domain-containing protein [Chitinophagales bacterium]|nr:LytTR family DNA-binding domain-containing protein [Chitinophagales bacterium]
MKIAYIIDDEMPSALLLRDKLLATTDYFDKIEIFTNPAEGYRAIQLQCPNIVFSDINMPGIKGLDLHALIANYNISFVYVTAYSNYTIDALRLQAFDYLMKPVKEEELASTIRRFIVNNEGKEIDKIHIVERPSLQDIILKQKEKLQVSTIESVHFLNIETIVKIEADNNYSKFTFIDSKDILVSKTLKYFENQLSDYGFVRVHKSFLVNIMYVDKLLNKDGGCLLLKNGDEILINKEKRDEIKKWFSL